MSVAGSPVPVACAALDHRTGAGAHTSTHLHSKHRRGGVRGAIPVACQAASWKMIPSAVRRPWVIVETP